MILESAIQDEFQNVDGTNKHLFEDTQAKYNVLNTLASHYWKLYENSMKHGEKSSMECQSYREKGMNIHK